MKSLIGSFVVIAALTLAACDKNAVVVDAKDASVAPPVACCADDAAPPVEVVDAGGTVVEPKPLVAPAAPITVDPPKTVSTSPVAAPVAPAVTTKK